MNSFFKTRFLITIILTIAVSACGGVSNETEADWSPDPDGPRAFVSTLGTDTVTVEVYTRTESGIEGLLVERTPATRITSYSAELDSDGNIVRFQAEQKTPPENPGGPAPLTWNVSLNDGSASLERTAGDNPGSVELEISGHAIPTLGRAASAMYVFEQVAMYLADEDEASPIELVGPSSSRPSINNAQVIAPDTISMDFFGSPRIAWMGEYGQILGASGSQTTLKTEVRRVQSLDAKALASRWAAMDARGEGIGAPSIPGNVSATVDGASLEVVYSRPAMRGRVIWGGLVPYGEVWRTGANAATHLAMNQDLIIGGVEVPAGTYTLWTLFTEGNQHLIINSQTQQWGTQYDESQDFTRVPLAESSLSEPVERFTISVEDTPGGGSLHLDWDRTRYSVDFTVQ